MSTGKLVRSVVRLVAISLIANRGSQYAIDPPSGDHVDVSAPELISLAAPPPRS
jgi:hypothetical protein